MLSKQHCKIPEMGPTLKNKEEHFARWSNTNTLIRAWIKRDGDMIVGKSSPIKKLKMKHDTTARHWIIEVREQKCTSSCTSCSWQKTVNVLTCREIANYLEPFLHVPWNKQFLLTTILFNLDFEIMISNWGNIRSRNY